MLDDGVRTGLVDGRQKLWLCLLGWAVWKNHIFLSFLIINWAYLWQESLSYSVSEHGVLCWCQLHGKLRALLALPSLAMPHWPIHSWATLVRGGHPMGVLAACAAPCWSVSSVFGRAHLHRFFCPPPSMSSHWKPAFSRNSHLFKMCCFHRLCLFLRIIPMDKGREGTKAAFDSRMVLKHWDGLGRWAF